MIHQYIVHTLHLIKNLLSFLLDFDDIYEYFVKNGLALIESDMNNNSELYFMTDNRS